jgi:signal peptidase I
MPQINQHEQQALASALADPPAPPPITPALASAPGARSGPHTPRRVAAGLHGALALALSAIMVVALLAGTEALLIKPFRVPSASMEPTLHVGQRVLVNRVIYTLRDPHRGEIIVFHRPRTSACAVAPPVGQSCPRADAHTDSVFYVKPILGLPGERIAIRDGHPVINGHEFANEPYTIPCPPAIGICELPRSITVPPGHYFVIGDNRPDSLDSRLFGPIPAAAIVGQVIFTYWPPGRIGTP